MSKEWPDLDDMIAEARSRGWQNKLRGHQYVLTLRLADALESVRAERDVAVEALQRVRDRHQPCLSCLEPHCFVCEKAKWPCAEFRALEGDE